MRGRRRGWFGRKESRDGTNHRERAGRLGSPRACGLDGASLADVPDGRTAIVTDYHGGEGLRRKAMDLGLVPGAPVEVLVRGAGRLMVVRIGETRVMIGHGVAQHVRVLVKE